MNINGKTTIKLIQGDCLDYKITFTSDYIDSITKVIFSCGELNLEKGGR